MPTACKGRPTGLLTAFFFATLAAIYFLGSYASLNTNITFDTETEQNSLRININAVAGLLNGDLSGYRTLQDYGDKYYGMGFHAPAYLVQKLLYRPIARYQDVTPEAAFLLVKHWLVFNLFFASGILVLLLSRRIAHDESFSRLVTLGYLSWPFLLGHAMFNVKDIPFLFVWMLCTYLSFPIMEASSNRQRISRLQIFMIGICTGWLIAIRISGGLILFQYAIAIFCTWQYARRYDGATPNTVKLHWPIFLASTGSFIMIAYPVFWADPLEIFNAIRYMSHHPMSQVGICSLVYGTCLPVAAASVLYLPAWLSAKLPVMIIAGVILLPFTLSRSTRISASATNIQRPFILMLFYTSLTIPAVLVILHAILYHDLRQVLFLMPLFYLSGVFSLYWLSRKFAIALLGISIFIFTADNFMAFPYQYIWFNMGARQLKVEQYFDTDYWNSSGKNSYGKLTKFIKGTPMANCIYADAEVLFHYTQPELLTYGCLKADYDVTPASPRPFIFLAPNTNAIMPVNCSTISEEKLHLFMGNGDIPLRTISYCK